MQFKRGIVKKNTKPKIQHIACVFSLFLQRFWICSNQQKLFHQLHVENFKVSNLVFSTCYEG